MDDIVKANILAAASDVSGEIFNIGGDGARIELNQAISLMEELCDKKANKEYQEMAKGDVKHTSADCSKAKELLDYQPEVGFEEGLNREVKWAQQMLKEGIL